MKRPWWACLIAVRPASRLFRATLRKNPTSRQLLTRASRQSSRQTLREPTRRIPRRQGPSPSPPTHSQSDGSARAGPRLSSSSVRSAAVPVQVHAWNCAAATIVRPGSFSTFQAARDDAPEEDHLACLPPRGSLAGPGRPCRRMTATHRVHRCALAGRQTDRSAAGASALSLLGMSLEWEQTIVDSRDPASLGRWWQEALGWVVVNDDPNEFEIRPAPDRLPGLLFGSVPEPKTVKNRLHLDLRPDDQDREVERMLALGASRADVGQGEQSWVVLADPEGNEFCILSSRRSS
jgi:hypothetical protein